MKYSIVRKAFMVFFVLVAAAGCSEFSTEIKVVFPYNAWNRFKPMEASFEITDLKKTYEVKVAVGVVDGFEHEILPLEIVITSPSGQQNILGKTLAIKKDGQYIGKARGDIWTSTLVIYPFKQFSEAGTYSVQILNRTQYFDLQKVESLSFEVNSVKIPKEKKDR